MEYYGNISGAKPHIRKYQVDGGVTIAAGTPVVTDADTADSGGVINGTTTAMAHGLGVSVDAATSTDAQPTTGNNVSSVTVVCNPDALWRCKLSNDASDDTALVTPSTAQAASTDGLTVTGATDEATIWAYRGANIGTGWRRATAANTVVVAFPNNIAALDVFLETLIFIGAGSQMITLNTSLTQAAARTAVATTDYGCFDLLLRDEADSGTTNSYAIMFCNDHAFKPSGT
jgi:hypothetical protein